VIRVLLLFLRRLGLPRVVFAGFSRMCVRLSATGGLGWQDAPFWMIEPHAIDAQRVHHATKLFSLFVYGGVPAFQI
jgi:hypothetical protein